jgi:hypothetical protein
MLRKSATTNAFEYGLAAPNQLLRDGGLCECYKSLLPGYLRFLQVKDLGSVDVAEHCCFRSMGNFLQPTG